MAYASNQDAKEMYLYFIYLIEVLTKRIRTEGTFYHSTIHIATLSEGAPWWFRLGFEHDTLRLLPLPRACRNATYSANNTIYNNILNNYNKLVT